MTNPYTELVKKYRNCKDEDAYRRNRNHDQLRCFRTTPKVNVDTVLTGRIKDDRLGCCIVARPNEEIKSLILLMQSMLRSSVSNSLASWVPPAEDLHMSVLEIANSCRQDEVIQIVDLLLPCLEQLLNIANDGPVLNCPLIGFDANAIALTFTSVDKSHIEYRQELFDRVASYGVDIRPRYNAPSAHITIMRFVDELKETDLNSLLSQIQVVNTSLTNTKWKVSNCEFNYGHIWYGQCLQEI